MMYSAFNVAFSKVFVFAKELYLTPEYRRENLVSGP